MKYISRWAALLLAVMMVITSAGAEITLDGLTKTQLDELYQTAAQLEILVEDVLGTTAELGSVNIQAWADSGYVLQWYAMDNAGAMTALDGQTAAGLDVTYTLTPQRFVCIATDGTDEYISPTFVVSAETIDMEGYLNYLYEPQFWNEDGTPNARAVYDHLNTVWNVDVDGVNLAQSVVEAWWAERTETWFDNQLMCSCVITGSVESDFCMLHPYAEHVGTCGWYTTVDVVEDETTGITVSGDLPAGVSLSVTAATGEMPEIDTRHFNYLRNYPLITGYNIALLNEDGSEYIVPDGTTVRVNIPSAWLADMTYPVVDVYHVKDSGEVVYLTSQFGEVVLLDDGSASFETDGFSDYWITSGSQYTNYFNNGESHVFYMVPGTEAQAGSYKWLFDQNAPNAAVWAETTDAEAVKLSVVDGMIYITLDANVQPNTETSIATVTLFWSGWDWTNSATVTIYAISPQDKEEINNANKFNNAAYPVQIAIRNDGVLPSEPSIYDSSPYTYFKSDLTVGSWSDNYSPTAEGVIDPDILNHERFYYESPKGQAVIGMYDATGKACLQFLSENIDWNKILAEILKKDGISYSYRDTDGVLRSAPANEEDIDDYVVIPYVVKCQETDGKGWHIDCAVALKDAVTLFYDFNLPDGITIKDPSSDKKIGLPNNERGVPNAKFTVGEIANMTQADDGTEYIEADPDYKLTFVGWNTAADGSGTMYQPDDSIRLTEDTTLYAIWSITPEIGTGNLRVRKIVQDDNATGNETFNFTIAIPDANEEGYDYTLYGADNVAVKGDDEKPVTGKAKDGDTLTLKNGQYVIIKSLPISKDGKTITVTEANPGEYVPSWAGGTANGTAVDVEIKDGRLSEVTCTNSKASSANTTLTVKKTGLRDGESAIIKVEVDGKTYMLSLSNTHDSDTIVNLPVGAAYTVTELNAWTWQYDVTTAQTGETAATGSTVTITNTQKTGNWMHDESSIINDLDGATAEDIQTPINNQ